MSLFLLKSFQKSQGSLGGSKVLSLIYTNFKNICRFFNKFLQIFLKKSARKVPPTSVLRPNFPIPVGYKGQA